MTMTINGSGTITGLAAGGLPDATMQEAIDGAETLEQIKEVLNGS